MKQINIGLLGLGIVGGGVFKNLAKNVDLIAERTGVQFAIKTVADLDPERRAKAAAAGAVVSDDMFTVIRDPSIDIVIELIGGCNAARTAIIEALRQGKTVVTANKALLAQHGAEIFREADAHN